MNEEAKGDYHKLNCALLRPSKANELFISRKWLLGEPAEVLISDFKRLAGLIGIKTVDWYSVEPFTGDQHLRVLPNEVSMQLHSVLATKSISLSEMFQFG